MEWKEGPYTHSDECETKAVAVGDAVKTERWIICSENMRPRVIRLIAATDEEVVCVDSTSQLRKKGP